MTPTLLGRWQTRLFLMSSVGLVITIPFAIFSRPPLTPFIVLGYVTLLGLGWDVLYQILQNRRWDRDWPPVFFCVGAIAEALFVWELLQFVGLPGVPPALTLLQFGLHYTAVWLTVFSTMLGPLKLIFLGWRFRGGEWL